MESAKGDKILGKVIKEAAMESITMRLSSVDNLYFPRSLQLHAADPSHRKSLLLDLLSRDPAVFLERYGGQLTSNELHEFDTLGDDYEIKWHLKNIRSKLSPTDEDLRSKSVAAKNRRHAYLNKLIGDGSYFSEDAMRHREPYLHHEFVGKFQDLSARTMAKPGERWSETLIRRAEEAILVSKIREEQQRLGVSESEWVGGYGESQQQDEEEEEEEEVEEDDDDDEENAMKVQINVEGSAPSTTEQHDKEETLSAEEDDKLRSYVTRHGHWNWRELPKFAGLDRCGKSCRLRWMNYLRPDLKHGNFSAEEDELIVKLFEELGTKWSAIASKMSGRTDNEIKNYWHAHLKKRAARWTSSKIHNVTESPSTSSSSSSHHLQHPDVENNHDHNSRTEEMDMDMAHHHPPVETTLPPSILESSPVSPQQYPLCESFNYPSTSSNLKHVNDVVSDEFKMEPRWDSAHNWYETTVPPPIPESSPFSPEHSLYKSFNHLSTLFDKDDLNHANLIINDGFEMEPYDSHNWCETVQREQVSNDANYSISGGDFWTEPFVVMDDGGGDMSYKSWGCVGDETTTLMFDDDLESLMYSVMRELPDTSF